MQVSPSQLVTLLVAAITKRLPILITGAPGVGKCLGKDTPILMRDGTIKAVQDVREGDILMGPDSKPRTVRALSFGTAPLFRVSPVKGDSYIVTGNHVLSLRESPKRKGQKRQTVNITVEDYLAASRTRQHHLKGWRTGVEFPATPVSVDPYILGLWLGDGDSRRMAFTNMDAEVLEAIVAYGDAVGLPAKFYSRKGNSRVKHVALTGKVGGRQRGRGPSSLMKSLESYGLLESKHIPRAYAVNSRAVRLEVLAGIIDTDGEFANNCYAVTQKSQRLADDIAFVARSLGFASYVSPCEKTCGNNGVTGEYHRVTISGDVAEIPVRIGRKKASTRKQIKNVAVTGITIAPIGYGAFYGFSVDADGLFMLGDFTVTHNSDIVAQAAADTGADVILSHPAVADPTDAKGLPWPKADSGEATFLPFGELARALKATKPTVWFLDDLGQATPAVQASFMQLILARRVNGHILPDCVTFVAATNRRTDRAGVSGILEPVKSRFASIVELHPDVDSWSQWAIGSDIPSTLIAFLRFRPDLLSDFKPSADMSNSPMPRTWASLAKLEALGLPQQVELAAMAGAVGEGPAAEYIAFRRMFQSLTSVDAILLDPKGVKLPTAPNELYATATALASKATDQNLARIGVYAQRLVDATKGEFAVLLMRDCLRRNPKLEYTDAFIRLSSGPLGQLISGGNN